jgi:hypothetical protein
MYINIRFSFSVLASSLLWLSLSSSVKADVIIRLTADPGGASEHVMTFTDGDAFDLDNTVGGIFIAAFSVFDGPGGSGSQTFDVNSLSVSSSSTLVPFDFDVLLDLISFAAANLRLEVTQTNLDPTEFVNGGLYQADIGGNAGLVQQGITMSYVSGFDVNNQAFALTSAVPQYNFDGSTITYNYSGSTPVSPIAAPFSMSARYDFTATGALQDIGFDSFNDISVPVPEPGPVTAAVACTSFVLWSLRKRRSLKGYALIPRPIVKD